MEIHWLSELVVLGASFSGGVLKVRVLDIVSNLFASQGKAGSCEFPSCAGVFMVTVAQTFLLISLWYFLIHPMCKNHSAGFWITFSGNCSICSYRFGGSMGPGEFRSLLFHHLVTEPSHSFHSLNLLIKPVPSQ